MLTDKIIKAVHEDIPKINSQLEQKAKQVDLETERERINNIVSVKDSVDNLETADIRISAYGKAYGSAGEAVREQIKYLDTGFDTFTSENLLDINSMTEKSYVNDSGVVVVNGGDNITSDFIDIDNLSQYCIQKGTRLNSFKNVSEYDENKRFLRNLGFQNCPITFSDDCKKVIVTINISGTETGGRGTKAKVREQKWQIFKGTKAKSEFEEYYNIKRAKIDDFNKPSDMFETINLFRLKNKYRYLCLSFIETSPANENMIILGTNNLKDFSLVEKRGIFKSSKFDSVRDPAIMQIGDWFYIVFTTISFNTGNTIGFARTKDFKTYEELDGLKVFADDFPQEEFRNVWAPAWFREGNDIYTITSCRRYGDNQGFSCVINKYNYKTHTLDSGKRIRIGGHIDAHIYKENDKYYVCAGSGKIYWSSGLFGTYTEIPNNISTLGHYEGTYCVKMDNGKWRMFMQEVNDRSLTNSSHMCYVDADSLGGTWGDIKKVSYDEDTYNYSKQFSGQALAEYWHWTIFDFNNVLGNNNNN